jgi:hypothetical protein
MDQHLDENSDVLHPRPQSHFDFQWLMSLPWHQSEKKTHPPMEDAEPFGILVSSSSSNQTDITIIWHTY